MFRYEYGGPVRMDNGVRSRSRRVEEMVTYRRAMIGPRGVRVGMSPRRVRHAMGSQMRSFITQQDVRVDLLAGPGGVTEWASLGAGRAFALGLAPTFQLAKHDAQIEGCCGGGLDPPSHRWTGTFTSRIQLLSQQVHQ